MQHDPFKIWSNAAIYFLATILVLLGIVFFIDRAEASGPDPWGLMDSAISMTIVSGGAGETTTIRMDWPLMYQTSTGLTYRFFACDVKDPTLEDMLNAGNRVGTDGTCQTLYDVGSEDFTSTKATIFPKVQADAFVASQRQSIIGVFEPATGYSDIYCPDEKINYLPYGPLSNQTNTQTWECNNWDWDYINLDGTSATTTDITGSIEFRYPVDNATNGTTTPDFSEWKVKILDTNVTHTYYIRIAATMTEGMQTTTPTSSLSMEDWSTIYGEPPTTFIWSIRKKYTVTPDPQEVLYRYTAVASLCSDRFCSDVVASDTVQFGANRNYAPMSTPYTDDMESFDTNYDYQYSLGGRKLDGTKVYKELAEGEWCPGVQFNFLDSIAWAMCKVGQFLVKPSNETTDVLMNQFKGMYDIFPFSILFKVRNTLSLDTRGISAKTLILDMTDVSPAFASSALPITILGSTTLNAITTDSQRTDIRQTASYVIWALTIGTMLAFILV